MILSPIEKQIKEKIERIGTPLKDWDIRINYGIKTGFNEAFIIDGAKRKELIEKDPKSEEIIRPLLRGRDIKRYSYEFADKYLIATFPSKNYNIDDFPAVKQFLNGFYPKLKQTGENLTKQEVEAVLNHAKSHGISINESSLQKSRKRTANKWFETQDTIAYWEDFYRPKIVWKRVGSILRFSYDESGKMALDSTCFATGKHIKFLVAVLNSNMGHYLLKDAPKTGTGDLLISVQAIEPLKIPIPDYSSEKNIELIIDKILQNPQSMLEKRLNKLIYNLYHLNKTEIEFIESLKKR